MAAGRVRDGHGDLTAEEEDAESLAGTVSAGFSYGMLSKDPATLKQFYFSNETSIIAFGFFFHASNVLLYL